MKETSFVFFFSVGNVPIQTDKECLHTKTTSTYTYKHTHKHTFLSILWSHALFISHLSHFQDPVDQTIIAAHSCYMHFHTRAFGVNTSPSDIEV